MELDNELPEQEVPDAIQDLSNRKATSKDNISAQVMKENTDTLLAHSTSSSSKDGEAMISQDLQNAEIVIMYKNKGDREDCNNYRGISLLSKTGHTSFGFFWSLQKLTEQVLSQSQCGSRARLGFSDLHTQTASRKMQRTRNVPLNYFF